MEVEIEGWHSDSAESERLQGSKESVSSHEESRGRLELMKKLKKVRSIRLVRLSSGRSSTRRGKLQYDDLSILSSIGTESLEGPIDMTDASPNYMKATTSSHARDGFQNTQGHSTMKTLARVSTLKLKRSVSRKLSAKGEPKRKLKSSRSIKFATVKGTKSTRRLSESTCGSDDQNRRINTNDSGSKPQRVITRRLSLRPVRILTKIPRSRTKNSQSPDSNLQRATCSSALKDSHFPDHIDLPQEGSASQGVSTVKVCPYSYCSLHGHRHGTVPPLKRFVSMRRRMLKAQKNMKMDGGQPVTRSKQFSRARKATQKTKTIGNEDNGSHFQNILESNKKNGENATVESTSTDVAKFPASDIEILEGEVTAAGTNVEKDYEELQMSSEQKESTRSITTTDVARGMPEKDKKYVKMWQLMYKHAVLSNSVESENKLPFDGNKDKEGRGEDALASNEENNSCHSYSETDQDTDDENKNAIELVQKAFDEILLPEPEDLFSYDHFKSRGADSDEGLSEKTEGKTEARDTSPSKGSPKEVQRMETKPDQRAPKSWSNLKKLLLLKRFVKALEKVRNINPRIPRRLPSSDANVEMEKVFLKRQTAEEKKNSEEWMLDYALQKVISKLAPAQRRRVTLLVEAFETVLPFQDAENSPRSSASMEPQENPIQSLGDSYSKKEASVSHNSNKELADNAGDEPMPEPCNAVVGNERCIEEDLSGKQSLADSYDNGEKISINNENLNLTEIRDNRSSSINRPAEIVSSCPEKAPTNEIVNGVLEDLTSNVNTENSNFKSQSPRRDVETKKLIGDNEEPVSMSKSLVLEGLVRSLRSNLVGSRDEPIEKAKLETETVDEFPTHEQSVAPTSAVVERGTLPEKQSYTGLWYLVYKHMVSDMAANNSKSTIEGADEKESGYEGSVTPATDRDMQFKDQVVADPEVELQRIEAIKMVEEAIDSIIPDDKDDIPLKRLLTDDTISDESKQSNGTERVVSGGLNQKEEMMESGNGKIQEEEEEEEETAPKEGSKTNKQLPRSWSNLKKVILLRRFIKALEKVRKFNPRGPRFLPAEPDSEAERVHLRHQDMEERKGTEEWMLDYALRQVVSKLTPERKRKVELLVEAFETVIPNIKN